MLFPEQKGFRQRWQGKEHGYLQNRSVLASRGVTLSPTQRATGSGRVPERMSPQGCEDLDLKDCSSGKKQALPGTEGGKEARPGF